MDRIGWADGEVVDRDGTTSWLLGGRPVIGWRLTQVVIDGRPIVIGPASTRWEVDEVEQAAAVGPVHLVLRHSLDHGWGVRLSVVNHGSAVVHLDRVELAVTTGPDWVGWAVRAGAEASIAAVPRHSGDPLIGFALTQGELRGDGAGLFVGPLVLEPSAQHVLRLRGEPYGSARAFSLGRHDLLPTSAWVEPGTEIQVHHPDLAVVAVSPTPPRPASEADAPGTDDPGTDPNDSTVLTGGPGEIGRLVLAGARGLVDIEVGVAAPLGLLVDRFVAAGEQDWPVGRQGTLIPSAASALVVQRHLASPGRGARPAAAWSDAVEGVCARLDLPRSALEVALVARQAMVTGDPDLADRAQAGLRRGACAPDELALVAPEVVVAGQLTGQFAGAAALPDAGPQAGPAPAQDLGARWGLGLRGGPLAAEDLAADARTLAVARVLTALHRPRTRGWACGVEELLDRQDRRVRHRLWRRMDDGATATDPDLAEALAWLVLAPLPG